MQWTIRLAVLCIIVSTSQQCCCSSWGEKLIENHAKPNQILQAITPVVTDPKTVHLSVTAMLGGEFTVSANNIEDVLVLANAIGVSCSVHVLVTISSICRCVFASSCMHCVLSSS